MLFEETRDSEIEEISANSLLTQPINNKFNTNLLNDLLALANKKKTKYPDSLKQYGLFVLLLSGNVLYDNLSKNLGLPSRSTELKYFASREDMDFKEGVLRGVELLKYLTDHEIPLHGWGSEDATKNMPGVRYSSKTNKMVGLVGPLDETGFPDLNSFEFNSIEGAYKIYQDHTKAEYVNVLMFQPLANRAMPFVLNLYGTDNRFTNEHVTSRWICTKNSLDYLGISLHGNISFSKN
jgi:hypothetical protein